MKQDILSEPAMVGREHELEDLTQNLESAIQGKEKTVFVSGEAGRGKTRVTGDFLSNARTKGIARWQGSSLAMLKSHSSPSLKPSTATTLRTLKNKLQSVSSNHSPTLICQHKLRWKNGK
jgi:hypothetical protein